MAHTDDGITLGFIGFGNMARAMAQGLVKSGALPGERICACAAHFDKLQANAEALGVRACETPQDVVAKSDLVVVAVKPHLVAQVLEPVRDALAAPGKAVISVAAGCGFDFYEGVLAPGTHHLSTIPNTPIAVGAGVVACEQRHSLSEDELAAFEDLFGQVALIEWVDGKLLSTASSVAGCGPAFAAMFLEALGDAGVKHGLPRATAYRLAAQMMMGTAKLHLETGTHPGAMKDAVCSPGGTTIKGVASLEKDAFRGAVINAIDAIQG
ncbi:pyrroline-5-carboxylate reductase [Arabiibacter massiliensis]|uniref:pyrroline-5-carboxylate reductase n=1 Tax=Arabiibacter massiliensis TaxID=1870985 RepID=UPI0009BC3F3B|nr:pyrroline-5-carboxylate reductase [Arabiibacter massiliensis]